MGKSLFRLIFVLLWILSLHGCGNNKGTTVNAQSSKTVGAWKNYPIVYYVDSSFPAMYEAALNAAVGEWNSLVSYELLKYGRSINRGEGNGKNVIYWIEADWQQVAESNRQAATIIKTEGSFLKEADIFLDAQNFYFSNEGDTWAIDVQSILTHEIGHLLGFVDDYTDGNSVMHYSIRAGQMRRTLTETDINLFEKVYKK